MIPVDVSETVDLLLGLDGSQISRARLRQSPDCVPGYLGNT